MIVMITNAKVALAGGQRGEIELIMCMLFTMRTDIHEVEISMVNYRILDKDGNVLYQGTTNNLERRIREYESRGLPDGWTVETD